MSKHPLVAGCASLVIAAVAGCDIEQDERVDEGDDSSADSDIDSDADTDPDTDGDTDADTDECEGPDWGSAWEVGQPVANWTQPGYVDADDDGFVDLEEVVFSLEDISCAGFESIVMLIGDTL